VKITDSHFLCRHPFPRDKLEISSRNLEPLVSVFLQRIHTLSFHSIHCTRRCILLSLATDNLI
jgi:hypothetical protein